MNTQLATHRYDPLARHGDLLQQILKAIQSVRYGQVQDMIQESRVMQIDKTEKLRLA